MKVKVIEEKCIGCGSCVSITDGQIFDFNDEGHAYLVKKEITKEEEQIVEDAINYCPTSAIEKD